MSRIEALFRDWACAEAPLPLPGSGATWGRFSSLAHQASRDLSLGRLCEGHGDALAILFEAGMKPKENASYGVWASRGRGNNTFAERVAGGWRLGGTKSFCSGSGIVERALVTADSSDGQLLFDLPVDEYVSAVVPDSWPAVGMAESRSETLEFAGVVGDSQLVGHPGFYTGRAGFWHGAAGVASCWYGGAVGLVNDLVRELGHEPSEHALADLGESLALLESMRLVLQHVASAIDEDPLDAAGNGHFLALVARQVVHDGAQTTLARVASAGGARPLCLNSAQARRAADLFVYLSQHHGRTESAELGRILANTRA